MQITILGCGTMGRAIATGLSGARERSDVRLVLIDRTPAFADALAEHVAGRVVRSVEDALDGADVLVVCVKPADAPALLADIALARARLPDDGRSRRRQVLVSIAAGVPTAAIEETLHSDPALAVVRAMPNTACEIGRGMTVLAGGTTASADDLALAHLLFERIGRVLELEERLFDTVTALSASGPAFLYLIIESLVDGGVRCGMPRRHALELATHMTLGAAALIVDSGKHPAVLRDEVTTPGGCTAVGLAALEDGGVRSTVARAVEMTEQRARVLGTAAAR